MNADNPLKSYCLRGRHETSLRKDNFFPTSAFRLTLGFTELPVQWKTEFPVTGQKLQPRENDLWLLSNGKVFEKTGTTPSWHDG